MSNVESWISIIGSFASIGGAALAIYAANEASKSATKAEKVRDELINRREIIEVSQVHSETKRILGVISNIGPSCNPALLTGKDYSGIAKQIEEYSRFLKEHSSHFNELFENRARKLCDDINKDISALSEVHAPKEVKKIGTRIYHKIDNFLPTAKSLADEKKEHIEADK